MNGQNLFQPYYQQNQQQQQQGQQQQQAGGIPVGYSAQGNNPSPYGQQQPQQQEIRVDQGNDLVPQAGPSGLQDHGLPDPLAGPGGGGVGPGSPDDDDSGILDTPGTNKRKGGRPRDKVWELFDGDRDVATCCYCSWKTDHPKAFRMRAHVISCDMIPQERKDDLARFQEQKEQRLAIKKEQADQALATGGGSAVKKFKRAHDGEMIASPSAGRGKMAPAPPARSPITCHVLDSTSGKPAPEMRIRLDRLNTTGFVLQAQGITDKDGRCSTLLPPSTRLEVGIFKITFFTNEWWKNKGVLSFYPFIEIPFEVQSPDDHYHIPCLLSPFSYTTYRGS
ncbi:hypothetical protein JCM3775_000154 [Rhodotorula graminis]